jgi:hypothetical protein
MEPTENIAQPTSGLLTKKAKPNHQPSHQSKPTKQHVAISANSKQRGQHTSKTN